MSALREDMARLDIHHLQGLDDFSGDFLKALLESEFSRCQSENQAQDQRKTELELFTWLSRINRSNSVTETELSSLGDILCRLLGADALLYTGEDHDLRRVYPEQLPASVNWQPIISALFDNLSLEDQPLKVLLDESSEHHVLAREALDADVAGSLILPIRCYKKVIGYFLVFFDRAHLGRLDVGNINFIEKTLDQLRTLNERVLAEKRLKTQYQRLQATLKKLHQAQEQLYHAEKMSSIGQLAAGLAHEINNPIAYVMNNFKPLDEYIQSMTGMLKMHEQFIQVLNNDDDQIREQMLRSIAQQQNDSDIEFILEDVFSLVSESRSGLQRVCDIVTNLRTFARKDTLETEDVDLVECLNSTLKLVEHQTPSGISVETQLPDEAFTKANSGLMGQVFLNLVQNAIHAIDEKGKVVISIAETDEQWQIQILDTGSGIPEEVRTKIFDPFFTTKPVGKGTGLGLSTVYSIIQRHEGKISFDSAPGKGTCFRILLPAMKG